MNTIIPEGYTSSLGMYDTQKGIGTLKRLLVEHPGESPVFLHLGAGAVLKLPEQWCCDVGRIVGELRVEFGADVVVA